ncbi:serine/threonine protein kinase [Planctomycetota bacterium]
MNKFEIKFEDLALKNRLMSELQVKSCREELLADGNLEYSPREFGELAGKKGFLEDSDITRMLKAIERLNREMDLDEEKVFDAIYIPGYEIIDQLGDGAIGSVFRARQISMKRLVALKVLHKKWLNDEEFKRRFLIEARAAGKLSHQNLIQVFDVGRFNDRYYFSMEYVDGQTVQNLIDYDGKVDLLMTLDISLQINRALNFLAQYNLVHRDIKPANIMMTNSGTAKVGDFGFIFAAEESKIAQEGMTLGTPDYISPEQAMGASNLDIRSDIYSLGATMFHMLSGNTVFTGTSSEVMYQHVDSKLPDLQRYLHGVPEQVVALIAKMMAKKPEDRYDCDELFEQLEYLKTYCESEEQGEAFSGGKTTLYTAFNVGKLRIARLERQNKKLKDRDRFIGRFLKILGIATIVLLIAVLLLLVKLLS